MCCRLPGATRKRFEAGGLSGRYRNKLASASFDPCQFDSNQRFLTIGNLLFGCHCWLARRIFLDTGLNYNYKIVKQFTVATVAWGVIGMLLGVFIAAQLAWPALNFDVPWLSYGRLRPLHTNAVIFAFGICGLFATSYYVVQRTCQVRLFSDKLAAFTFWGWQAVLVLAVITLPMGWTRAKEYAELEWPITILIAVVWVAYATVFFGTLIKRKVAHIYVANWFFGGYILAVALLHIINGMSMPV